MWLFPWCTEVTGQPLMMTIWNLFFSFKFPLVLGSNVNLAKPTSRQAWIPRSIPRLQTNGKGRACCKQQGHNRSQGIYAQQQAAPLACLCPSPEMKGPYLPLHFASEIRNQLQMPRGCPKWCSAARGCFLPSRSPQGRGEGSAEGQALPVLQQLQAAGVGRCGVNPLICPLRL